jgi:lipopolysaccharide assembly outer membrane protein LptD (OstA)
MIFSRLLFAVGGLAALIAPVFAQDAAAPPLEVESLSDQSELENDFASKTWVGRKGIIVKQGSTILVADEVRVDEATRKVVAEGMVSLQGDGVFWTGDHLEYDFTTREIGAGSYRAGLSGIFMAADNVQGNSTNRVYNAENATFTTDDLRDPGYRIRAKKVRIEVGKEVVAHDATLYLGRVPVFYLPYYRKSMQEHRSYFVETPGYRSSFGPYLLSEYHYVVNEHLDAGLHMDYRVKRGIAVGPEFNYDSPKYGTGDFLYYFAPDDRPPTFTPPLTYSDDRQMVRFHYSVDLRTNLTAKASVNYQSDPLILRDFFEGQYRTNAQPRTVFEVAQHWSNFSLSAVAQPQVNEFFQTVERLPDIKLSALRQQLGVSPLFYEGESSFAYLRNRPNVLTNEYAAMRADTYHQIILPKTFFGFLNVTPRVGGRLTHYSETESPYLPLDDEDRFVFNTGMETSFKASRVYKEARSSFLDVTELRHIIEPSVNYVFVPEPNVRPGKIPQFDTEIPSLRLLPVDFPDYNQIDSIDSKNVLRLGLRNKLQTKRDGEVDTLVNWFLVSDWRIDPLPTQSTFSDFYSDLDFKPRRWLTLNSETRYDVENGLFNLSSHSATIEPNNTWSARVGHRYFRGDTAAYGPDSDNNIIFSSLYYRLNENWGARMSHHFEARDGTMEEQYYTLYRDFRSFTGAFTFRVRDQRVGPMDYTIAFTMQLKMKPSKGNKDRVEPSFLLGN